MSIEKTIAVGGLPHPIGGVTNFILRLADSGLIDEVWDIYPDRHKISIPGLVNVVFLSGVMSLTFRLFSLAVTGRKISLFFNFSRPRALLLFLIVPKGQCRFSLMLHHGDLKKEKLGFFYKSAVKRFDRIYCISKRQCEFFKDLGVSDEKISLRKSYLPPMESLSFLDQRNLSEIDEFFRCENVFICSGYPSSSYNHDWCINYVENNPEWCLAIFLYGHGDSYEYLLEKTSALKNVKIFVDCNQFEFNYALNKSKAYLRPTFIDSFGVAVADAFYFNIPVLASDVCERYPGSCLFSPTDYQSFEQDVNNFIFGRVKKATGDPEKFRFRF